MNEKIFNRMTESREIRAVYENVLKMKRDVKGQLSTGEKFFLQPREIRDGWILGEIQAESELGVRTDLLTTFMFDLEDEFYFFKAPFETIVGREARFKLTDELYKLQRRNHYRVPLDRIMGCTAEIQSLNGSPAKVKVKLLDLSGGGCAIEFPAVSKVNFKANDRVKAKVIIPSRMERVIEGSVRHVRRRDPKDPSSPYIAGIQFLALDQNRTQAIIQHVMEIHRDLFSKYGLDAFQAG
ncbi:MAG: PilZ domain-containing protein [Bdellovibrionales bacterium]|nr:PilZ domain-containing protein [Bdellovibrionales bacterium]